MTRKLLLATRNQKKKRELETILSSLDIDLVTLDDIEGMPEIEEDGDTFAANAIKKAQTIALLSGFVTLADDSGLVVDALNGSPGIFSARFAGPEASDADNNRKLLALMQDVLPEHRTARFVCVIAVATPEGNVTTVQGVCEGSIGFQAHGQNGFGYDPFFIPSGFQQTFAELSEAEKNQISHRGRALLSARQVLQQILSSEGTA